MDAETPRIVVTAVIVPETVKTDEEYQRWAATLGAARALADLMAFCGLSEQVASDLATSHYTDKQDAPGWTERFLEDNTEAVLTWLRAKEE